MLVFHINTIDIACRITTDLEWNIKIGDSRTFIYTKFYDDSLLNPYQETVGLWNGTPDPLQRTGVEFVYITYKKGLTMDVTVTSLDPSASFCKVVFNENLTLVNQSITQFVTQTVDNRTYWDVLCSENNTMTISDNILTITYNTRFYAIDTSIRDVNHIYKWNWKTGWLVYAYMGIMDNFTNILYETEFTVFSTNNSISNIIFGSSFLGLAVMMLILTFRFNKRRKNRIS
jgi:hypothetical protein